MPQKGRMMLLDGLIRFDADGIVCSAHNHRADDHPLLAETRLSSLAGIEYAAQSMALHGALLAQRENRSLPRGLVGLMREIECYVDYLDDIEGELNIHAFRIAFDTKNLMYRFEIFADERILIKGRLAVFSPKSLS